MALPIQEFDQDIEQKRQAALEAGASLQEVDSLVPPPSMEQEIRQGNEQDEEEISSMDWEGITPFEETVTAFPEDTPYVSNIDEPIRWNKAAATEYAHKLQLITGIEDFEVERIVNDLTTKGKSYDAQGLMSTLTKNAELGIMSGAVDSIPVVGGANAAKQMLQSLKELEQQNILDDAMVTSSISLEETTDNYLKRLDKHAEAIQQLRTEYRDFVQFTGTTGGNVVEFGVAMFPGLSQTVLSKLGTMLKERFKAPLDANAEAFILQGEYAETIREWISEQSPDVQLDIFRAVRDSMQAMNGLFSDNDFIKMDMMDKMFATSYAGTDAEHDLAIAQGIDNAVSIADIALVGGLVKGIGRIFSGVRETSSLAKVARVDTKAGQEAATAAIVDKTGNTATKLGTTREDVILDSILPKWKEFNKTEDAANSSKVPVTRVNADLVVKNTRLIQDLQNSYVNIGDYLTDAEKIAQLKNLEEAFASVKGMHLNVGRSEFYSTDAGNVAVGRYSLQDGVGFDDSTIKAAKTRLENMHPEGKVEEITEDGTKYLQLTVEDKFKISDTVTLDLNHIYGRGAKAKFLGDASANLDPVLANPLYTSLDRSRLALKRLTEFLNPLFKAKNQNKGLALSLVDEARNLKEPITVDFILDKLPRGIKARDAQEVVDSVFSIKSATDASYVLANRHFRDVQIAAGRKHINYNDFNALATPLSKEQAIVLKNTKAYDPITDSLRPLTKEEIEAVYEEGGFIARSAQTHGNDAQILSEGSKVVEQSEHILVTGNVKSDVLPQQVLNYDNNYITTFYKDQYYVKQVYTVNIDGKLVEKERILNIAKSKKDAETAIAEIKKRNPNWNVDYKNARELTHLQNSESFMNMRLHTGGVFYSKKGERLSDYMGNLADVEGPIESIQKQLSSVAKLTELKPVIDLMKQRFINKFPQFSNNGFPRSIKDIMVPDKVVDDTAEAAKVMWDYINILENHSLTSAKWQNLMIRFGEWLENTGAESLGKFTRTTIGKHDPLSTARSTTFMATIALNPVRQFVVQSQQYTVLAGLDPKFVMSGKLHRQGGVLAWGLVNENQSIKAAAKIAGMSEKEYALMQKGFKESGLSEAVDVNALGRDALFDVQNEFAKTGASLAAQKALDAGKKVIQTSRTIGFDMGERLQIAGTYSLAWKRFRDKFPDRVPTSKDYLDIQADARQLAFGMTSAGRFGYQEGVLSLATQFLSFQHKAGLAMMRGIPGLSKFGNKAITEAEGRRILLFQAMLYGPIAGWGLGGVIDPILDKVGMSDVDPVVRQLLYGGAVDAVLNTALQASTGEESDINFAASLSAGQGFAPALTQIVADTLVGDKSLLEVMTGPSQIVGSRVGKAVDITKAILLGAPEITPELGKQIFVNWAGLASGYLQYANANAMLNLGQWVDSNRAALPLKATTTDAILKGMFGFNSYQYEALYKHFNNMKNKKADIEGASNLAYNMIMQRVSDEKRNGLGEKYLAEMQEAFITQTEILKGIFGKDTPDFEAVMANLSQKLRSRDSKYGDFASALAKAVVNNTYGGGMVDNLNHLERTGVITKEQANNLRVYYNKVIGGDNAK